MKIFLKIITGICIAFVVVAGIYSIVFRFQHPELTETEVALKFWPVYPVVFVLAILYPFVGRLND